MIEVPGRLRRGVLGFKENRSPILWIGLVLLLSVAALMLVFFLGGKSQKPAQIPPEVLGKIDQEKAKVRQEYAEFIQTPAGKLWLKHPYWSPDTCQRIVEGQVFPGMSKEQAKEAVNQVVEVRKKKGNKQPEEWTVEGRNREKMVLKFEENALVEIERK